MVQLVQLLLCSDVNRVVGHSELADVSVKFKAFALFQAPSRFSPENEQQTRQQDHLLAVAAKRSHIDGLHGTLLSSTVALESCVKAQCASVERRSAESGRERKRKLTDGFIRSHMCSALEPCLKQSLYSFRITTEPACSAVCVRS